MNASFYSGVLGVKTQGFGIDITSHNIANINTPGFKYSQAEFADIFYKRVSSQGTNPTQAGVGSQPSASKITFEQGSFIEGEGEFDVALHGRGFFGLLGANNQAFYTRNGAFVRDGANNLVDAYGNFVLGTMNPNFTPTAYSQRVSEAMGRVLGTPVSEGWTINNPMQNFDIGTSTTQTSLFVPKNLYYFPEVTTQATFRGTISVVPDVTVRNYNLSPINASLRTTNTTELSFEGNIADANANDEITVLLEDENGNSLERVLNLDQNLNFSSNITVQDLGDSNLDMNSAVISKITLKNGTELTQNLPTLTKNASTATLNGAVNNITDINGNTVEAKPGDKVTVVLVSQGRSFRQEVTLNEDLSFSSELTSTQTGLDLNNATVSGLSLVGTRENYANKNFGIRVYNADGSVSVLRYTLMPRQRAEGEDFVYDVVAGVYDTLGNLQGGQSTGLITFNQFGALTSNSLTSIPNPNGGEIAINFGTPTNEPSTNRLGPGWDGIYVSLTDRADNISSTGDGFAEGFFSKYLIHEDGSLIAQFDNGRTAIVAKLALYNFINEQGLSSVGSNNFAQTSKSGPASFLFNNQGQFVYTAKFVRNKLESSNADLSVQLTDLIVMQKAYDASAKSITTSDSLIQTALNMKS
ncbi:flagellar hook-basal body complex protein [Campylobacter troglodytis]|uniref:flagellar hook-basal body complex protein n=1 Tax=Campylobacter troglodytis TaxID=654363 RepID=UPI00115B31FA|nr:flagellar hook-basal body complex protein [Campylobacter troglodytis]TQR56013.1 flagellar hook protein FlgE [Campylobacter troglodytis]